VEEEPFWIDRMGTKVLAPSQATVHLNDRTPRDLYYEFLDEGEAWQFLTPTLLYTRNCDKPPKSSQRAPRELPESSHLQALVKCVLISLSKQQTSRVS
jgi:hypothetical protein